MGAVLLFPLSGVRVRWAHAKNAESCQTPYGVDGPSDPGLFWVKDSGTYLMSNGLPGEPIGANATYAEGFGPDADWSVLQDACGGDDFVELIPGFLIEQLLDAGTTSGARYLFIDARDGEFEVGLR